MREILFRGKSREDGGWIYGGYFTAKDYLSGETMHFIAPKECESTSRGEFTGAIEIAPETLGQHTVMTDKNGVKIFEGDILQMITDVPDGKKMIYTVNWCEKLGKWVLQCVTDDELDTDFTWFWGFDFKIIGNIHDNPEMLGDADA